MSTEKKVFNSDGSVTKRTTYDDGCYVETTYEQAPLIPFIGPLLGGRLISIEKGSEKK